MNPADELPVLENEEMSAVFGEHETQDLIDQEVSCNRFLELMKIPKKKKTIVQNLDQMSLEERRESIKKQCPLVPFLLMYWNSTMILEMMTEVSNELERLIDLRDTPAATHYYLIIKTFLIWKFDERYSGKCGPELFEKWACEVGYSTIFGNDLVQFTTRFLEVLLEILS